MANERWILDWQDRSADDDRRILVSVDSIDEFRQRIKSLLEHEEWTPPNADELGGPDTISAYQAFQDEVIDLSDDESILELWTSVSFDCDDGTLCVVRER